MNVKRIKKYVEVTAAFDANGRLRPLFIKWDDGREFHIDKIKDIRRTNSVAVAGKGIRYTFLIWGKGLLSVLRGKLQVVRRAESCMIIKLSSMESYANARLSSMALGLLILVC